MNLQKELKELSKLGPVTGGISAQTLRFINEDIRRLQLDYIDNLKRSVYRFSMKSVDTKKTKKAVELLNKAIYHFEQARDILKK